MTVTGGYERPDLGKDPVDQITLEAAMAGAVVVMAIAVFVGGVLIGAIGAVAVGVGREDPRYPLAARRLTGLGRRHLNGPLSR